jgi:ABC-type multidrug transport system fused ATPase/permease subunit
MESRAVEVQVKSDSGGTGAKSDSIRPTIEEASQLPIYWKSGNVLRELFYGHLNPLLSLGTKKELRLSDLGTLGPESTSAAISSSFAVMWDEESKRGRSEASLLKALTRTVGYSDPIVAVIYSGMAAAFLFGPPLILRALSNHFIGVDVLSESTLWILVALLFVLPTSNSLLLARCNLLIAKIVVKVRGSLETAIYRKILLLTSTAKGATSSGQIINLVADDVLRIQQSLVTFADPLFAPAIVVVALFLIYYEVGISMVAAIVVVTLVFPLIGALFKSYFEILPEKMRLGDQRVALINEVLNGIRIVKYYAWETPFIEKINGIREPELDCVAVMCRAIMSFVIVTSSMPALLQIGVFLMYTLLGNQLTVTKAFTTVALLSLLNAPMHQIPGAVTSVLRAKVSIDRVAVFLLGDEFTPCVSSDFSTVILDEDLEGKRATDVAIQFRAVSAGWIVSGDEKESSNQEGNAEKDAIKEASHANTDIPDSSTPGDIELASSEKQSPEETTPGPPLINRSVQTLMDASFTIFKGELVAIVGTVSSGKSSLLSSLMNELTVSSGSIFMSPGCSIAYHSQQPWILNRTIKENITLGSVYDEERFEMAVKGACLGNYTFFCVSFMQSYFYSYLWLRC